MEEIVELLFVNIDEIDSDLLNKRMIFLIDEINSESANKVCKQLLYLNSVNHDPIKLYINSTGGGVIDAFSIIDTMESIKAPVYTIGYGMIYSAASMVFVSGEQGHRYVSKRCRFLIHPITQGSDQDRNIKEIKSTIKDVENIIEIINDLYKKNLNKKHHKKLNEYLESYDDNYFFGKEAIKLGIADKLIN